MINTRLQALSGYAVPAGNALLSSLPSLGRLRALTIAGPLYQLGNTLLSRHEGGIVPAIPMRAHLVFDAVGATELIEIVFSDDRDAPARDWVEIVA